MCFRADFLDAAIKSSKVVLESYTTFGAALLWESWGCPAWRTKGSREILEGAKRAPGELEGDFGWGPEVT